MAAGLMRAASSPADDGRQHGAAATRDRPGHATSPLLRSVTMPPNVLAGVGTPPKAEEKGTVLAADASKLAAAGRPTWPQAGKGPVLNVASMQPVTVGRTKLWQSLADVLGLAPEPLHPSGFVRTGWSCDVGHVVPRSPTANPGTALVGAYPPRSAESQRCAGVAAAVRASDAVTASDDGPALSSSPPAATAAKGSEPRRALIRRGPKPLPSLDGLPAHHRALPRRCSRRRRRRRPCGVI